MSDYRKEQERNLMSAIEKARNAVNDGTLTQVTISPRDEFMSKFSGVVENNPGRTPVLIPNVILRRLERSVADELNSLPGRMVVGMPRISLDLADAQAILAAAQKKEV